MRLLGTGGAVALVVAFLAPLAGALTDVSLDGAAPADRLAPPGAAASEATAAGAAPGDYIVRFRCPERIDAPPQVSLAPDGDPVCPSYILDREDIFGQPVFMVDPRNPEYMAFSAMHGGRGLRTADTAASERSRDDAIHQPHTTFTSKDGGASWTDMPYHAPDALQRTGTGGQRTRDIFGEDNAAAQDAQGRLYLAALYAYRDTGGSPLGSAAPFHYGVGVWKAKGPEYPVDYHVNTKVIDSGNEGANKIDSIHLVYVPGTDVVASVWRETTPEALLEVGNATRVVLHATKPADGAVWTPVDVDIGPCDRISNPIAYEGVLYVACGTEDEGARVYAVDTATWTARMAGTADVLGQHLQLVHRHYGFMVLIGSGLHEDGAPIVDVAYGERGGRWSTPDDLAAQVAPLGDFPLIEGRVTAAAYAPRSGNLHVVWLERRDLASGNADDGQTPEFAKSFASFVAEGRFLARVDLGVGSASRVGFAPTLTGVGSGAFNDLHDSIVLWDGTPYGVEDREFVAFGDHGYVRFAEVVEENFVPPLPITGAGVPAVPFATPGTIPLLVGVPAALLAGAAVARTIAARRAAAVEVGSE